ncbi:MAG: hypothetical protein M3R36_15035 [Bacteroidota bacterium]|nr:hypothetical protein [Bacteroidota bacterium]
MKKEKKLINSYSLLKIFLITIAIGIFRSDSFSVQDTAKMYPSSDNTLYDDSSGSLSNGIGDYFFTGTTATSLKRRGLVRFNFLDAIPPCANIIRVTLRLHMSKTIAGNKNIELRKLHEDWGEGLSDAPGEEGTGTAAETGDATWQHKFYDNQFWTRDGGTFSNTVSASITVGGNGFYTWGSTSQMVADAQSWVSDPTGNSGWLLLGDESSGATAKRFDSRQNDSVNFRPFLTVIYDTPNSIALNLSAIIEGFWNGSTMVRDTIKAYLHSSVSPYARVDSAKANFRTNGDGTLCFKNAPTGSYYIVVDHRNSIDTWSKFPQLLTVGFIEFYEFVSSASQAFGDNETLKLGAFCIYSGDVNKDGIIDLNDTEIIDNDAANFLSGYVQSDVTGDDFVDVTDASIADNNSLNFVMVRKPQ